MIDYPLRCDRCHHFLDNASESMQLVGLFRASSPLRFPKTPGEKRIRCPSCHYINVFYPLREQVA